MTATNELIYEVLKKVQADVAVIKTIVGDHTRLLVRMREDDLRLEAMQNETQLRLDRIEQRMEFRSKESVVCSLRRQLPNRGHSNNDGGRAEAAFF
jgi:hypothetical protein